MPEMGYDFRSDHAGRIVADRERAIAEVEPMVPRHVVMAADSAANVFKMALDHLGVPTANLDRSAYPAMFRITASNRRSAKHGGRPAMAQDAASAADFDKRFPGASRIRTVI